VLGFGDKATREIGVQSLDWCQRPIDCHAKHAREMCMDLANSFGQCRRAGLKNQTGLNLVYAVLLNRVDI
jgi:hypothetical protein